YLAARPSTLVSKDELFKALWPDVAVTDNALTQAISELRQALGDDPVKPKYVQTVARRGYRFIAPVEAIVARPAFPAESHAEPASHINTVAVLDFENVSGDSSLAWLAKGNAETVSNDLGAATLRMVDRMRFVEAVGRIGRDLTALHGALGIDLAVVGSFQRSGDRLRITGRVVDATMGEPRT